MARRMPKGLELWRRAYGIVNFHGVPMYRCLAWALHDYELHGGHLIVNSADRRDGVIRRFNRKYGNNLSSQKELWEGFRAGRPGFFPANPPGHSSHELVSDGNPFYGRSGRKLPRYMLGIDAVNHPGGDASHVVIWLNDHGYHTERPYLTASERHHLSFSQSPASHARRRLRVWKAGGR
jgi:hypothetical protein